MCNQGQYHCRAPRSRGDGAVGFVRDTGKHVLSRDERSSACSKLWLRESTLQAFDFLTRSSPQFPPGFQIPSAFTFFSPDQPYSWREVCVPCRLDTTPQVRRRQPGTAVWLQPSPAIVLDALRRLSASSVLRPGPDSRSRLRRGTPLPSGSRTSPRGTCTIRDL